MQGAKLPFAAQPKQISQLAAFGCAAHLGLACFDAAGATPLFSAAYAVSCSWNATTILCGTNSAYYCEPTLASALGSQEGSNHMAAGSSGHLHYESGMATPM
eukprot:6212362-Pleurochrysis_carterae.AAC.13